MTAPNNKPLPPEQFCRFVEYYRLNPAWGSLHIVLEDYNIRDSHIQFCIDYATEHGDAEGAELGRILLTMSKSQRLSLPSKVAR